MKSAHKQQSFAENQKEERTSTGKKLIQARLPFKILPAAGTDSKDTESAAKKRKLQFEDDNTNKLSAKLSRKSISKSDVKENVSVVVTNSPSTTIEISSSSLDPIPIEGSDDEECSNAQSKEQQNSTNSKSKVPLSSQSLETPGGKDHDIPKSSNDRKKGGKLKIKLPFGNGKKKRNRRNDSTTSKEDDGDEEVTPNPLKKAKKNESLDALRKENNSTPNSVIELISDDDEPIDDSDASTVENIKCLDKKNNQKTENVHDNKEKLEEDTVPNHPQENGEKFSKFRLVNLPICPIGAQTENRKDGSNKAVGDGDNKISLDDSILVEDDDTNTSSKQSISTEASQSSLCRKFDIKCSSVRISKGKFKKLMKNFKESRASDANEQIEEISEQEDEQSKSELHSTCVSIVNSESEGESIAVDSENESSDSAEGDKEAEKSTLNANSDVRNDSATISSTSKGKPSPKLTPARLKKLKKMEKRREERLRMKEEKEKKLQEERDQKKKEKEEKELQRKKEREDREELKRKEREEKEEQKRKEKEEKEKKRLAEIDAKNEERRQKEEEKRRREETKEEERRRKEEERRKKEQEKEEAEWKKKREAEAFTKFFVLHKPSSFSQQQQQQQKENDANHNSKDSNDEPQKCFKFMPFQVKDRMKLAPLCRKVLNPEAKACLDKVLIDGGEQDSTSMQNLYLSVLKSGKYTPGQDTKTYPKDDESSDVLVIDELEGAGEAIDETIRPQRHKAKFLYFHENQRPPYYGTWRKKSEIVKPRRPFATDMTLFDYEVDSDEEWEEEEPGESLSGTDDEKDKESEDEYEVDNEFFVPHGHLSEEEMKDGDEEEDNSPETQKAKLKLLQQEFAQDMKKKTEKIKPKLVGIVWQDENGNKPDQCPDVIWASLNKRAMMFTIPPIVVEPEKSQKQQDTEIGSGASPNEQKQQKQKDKVKLTEDLIKDLIRLFHGNTHNKEFLIKEFQAHITKKRELNQDSSAPNVEYSKATIRKKIDKMAEWTIYQKNEKDKKKLLWVISPEYLKRYNLEELSLSNQWTYILQPKKRLTGKIDDDASSKQTPTSSETIKTEKDGKTVERKSFPAITKFTKVLSKEEKLNQMKNASCEAISRSKNSDKVKETKKVTNIASSSSSKSPMPTPVVKKRVSLLMSVPRGQQIPQERKDKLISDFLKTKQHENEGNKVEENASSDDKIVPMEIDNEVIVLN